MSVTLKDAYKDFVKQVLRSSLTSVALYTAPAQVKRKESPKDAIKRLRSKIAERMGADTIYRGAPMGEDKVWADDRQYSPTGIYVKDKRSRNKRTNIPVYKDADSLYKWWLDNSTYDDRKGVRRRNRDAYAFVSSQSVIKQLVKKLQRRAGNYMSGWDAYARAVLSKIGKLIPTGTYDYDGDSWWIDDSQSLSFVADNKSAPDKSLAAYNQRIIDTYLPKQIEYHAAKTMPYFVRSLQRKFNLTAAQAKEIIATIKI